jgi:DNA polymerase V
MRSIHGGGLAVETTASFPNPAQDYYEGPISLDRHLIKRPASTFVLRVSSDALRSMGIHVGDELLVDRALRSRPGRVIVVVHDGEHRLGRFEVIAGRAVLVTDLEEIPLTADVEPWGVATVVIHHLPLGPASEPAGGGR